MIACEGTLKTEALKSRSLGETIARNIGVRTIAATGTVEPVRNLWSQKIESYKASSWTVYSPNGKAKEFNNLGDAIKA